MTWIKICGITDLEDARLAIACGADALGFIFAPSPRRVDPSRVEKIVRLLPPGVFKVGVFVNEDPRRVLQIAGQCDLDFLQLHGEESPEYCRQVPLPVLKAIRVRDRESLQIAERYPMTFLLLDAWAPDRAGGTGKTFPWEIAREIRQKKNFILSGGLTAENVAEAIRELRPMGVDANSGVEKKPGVKDPVKVAHFIKKAREAEASDRSGGSATFTAVLTRLKKPPDG
jgi:phosphoribosylanthranilate isomerase